MTRALLLAVLLTAAQSLAAQQTAVTPPPAALAHLLQQHPGTAVKEWKQGAKLYRAVFTLKGEKYTAVYTTDGSWVRTEHNIRKEELPKAVHKTLLSGTYSGWEIDDVEEHRTPMQAQVFKVDVKSDRKKAELFLLPDGTLLKEEVKERKGKGEQKN
jgi:hypothetical protein